MAIIGWLELIERAITNGIQAWLGVKRNGDKITKLQAEVERLQNQYDEINMRSLNHDLRLDSEEKTVTNLVASTEIIEGKVIRAVANSEHALELVRNNNATRNP
jgi:hypothetical protein